MFGLGINNSLFDFDSFVFLIHPELLNIVPSASRG